MCTGIEVAALIGAGASAVSAISAMSKSGPSQATVSAPEVVQQNPVADQETIDTQAAQEAQATKLEARRRARANSLLSAYGGAGDTGAVPTTAGVATGKTSLGA